jgi:CHRD domain
MHKTLRRSISVFIAVTITTLCIYGIVRVSGVVFPGYTATASVTTLASSPGAPPPSRRSAATGQGSATSSQGGGSGSTTLYVCPRTGCTATSCHGATGAPPPSGGGQGGAGSQGGTSQGGNGSGSGQGYQQAPSAGATRRTTTASGTYTASLAGADVVPPVSTRATGTVTFTSASNGTALRYVLRVRGISNPTVARLHEDATGANGPTIATLFAGPAKKGSFTGTLASGTLRATSLGGLLAGKKLADLLSLIKAGKIYVLLGTTKYRTGEIRGQIK